MARGLAVAVALAACLVAAAPAGAAAVSATCATLQSVLNGAAQGDVITLNSSDGPGELCNAQYTLKSFPSPIAFPNTYTTWQLQGRTGQNDGFDGTGLPGRVLTGINVHRLEIWDLTFRNSVVTGGNGGALDITGESSVGLRLSEFYSNSAAGKGGAVHLSQVARSPARRSAASGSAATPSARRRTSLRATARLPAEPSPSSPRARGTTTRASTAAPSPTTRRPGTGAASHMRCPQPAPRTSRWTATSS